MAKRSIVGRDRRRFSLANTYRRGMQAKNQIINVTDLIAEGPIEGLADSTNSVFLDGDPIFDTSGESAYVDNTDTQDLTISFGTGASVTATLSSAQALNTLAETDTDNHRFMFVYRVHEFKATIQSVEDAAYTTDGNGNGHTPKEIIVEEKVSSANPFHLVHVSESANIFHTNHRVRVRYKNAEMDCFLENVLDSSDNVKTDGNGPRGLLSTMGQYGRGVHALITDEDAEENVEVDIIVDAVFKVNIITSSGNKAISLANNHTNAYSVTNKGFSLSTVLNSDGQAIISKVKNSSVQFRVGNEFQAPLKQLAGVGTSSLAISLSTSTTSAFSVIGRHWRSNNSNNYGGAYFRDDFTSNHEHANWRTHHAPGNGTGSADASDGFDTGSSRITLEVKNVILSSTGLTAGKISEIDELRIQIRFPSGLYHLDNGGNTHHQAAGHQIHVFIKRDGNWLTDTENKYVGDGIATMSKRKVAFSIDETIDMTPYQPFEDLDIQVTRLTPTGQDNTLSDDEYEASSVSGNKVKLLGDNDDNNKGAIDGSNVASIIAIIKEKLNYPFTALGSVTFNSEDYQSSPVRTYQVRGKLVRIPSNYTPRHLSASGKAEYKKLWDGTFSDVGANDSGLTPGFYYTDNPAWVFLDLLTHERYGLGNFIDDLDIDKYALYKIAKYCDEEVPDGKGGVEPRFRANIYLTKGTDSYKVLKDMATIFRGMLYWLDGQLLTVQDTPSTPIYNFGPSNILGGMIDIEGTGAQTRPNQVIVTWNNPDSSYKLEPLIVEDRKNIIETGKIVKEDAMAFGCTSEGQAIRYGKWKLWTAVNQTEIVSFKTGINAAFISPGDIINIQDDKDHGITFSGRVSSYSNAGSASTFTLDRDISSESGGAQVDGGDQDRASYTFNANSTYTLSVLVDHRKVVLLNDSATINSTSYSRGDIIQQAFLPNDSGTYVLTTIDMTKDDNTIRSQIALARDAASGDDVLLALTNATAVETRSFNSGDVTVSSGKTVIAIDTFGGAQAAEFDGTVTNAESVWVIKEVNSGSIQDYSYKEFKVVSIKEENDGNFGITAAEFSNAKFEAVDREFLLDVADTVYVPEEVLCPAPANLYVLRVPSYTTLGDEVLLQWEHPLKDGENYEFITGYEVEILGADREKIVINEATTYSQLITGLGNGSWTFAVRAVTIERKSKFISRNVELTDIYGTYNGPRIRDLPVGVQCDWKNSVISSTTFKMFTEKWLMKSVADITSAALENSASGQSDNNSWQQDLVSMSHASLSTSYLLFDRELSSGYDYIKLVDIKEVDFDNASIDIWYDVSVYAPSGSGGVENNRWTHVDCNVSVPTGVGNNIVTKTGGSTGFFTAFKMGDVIRLQSGTSGGNPVYVAAKVAYIESDEKLFVDRTLNNTTSTLAVTANSTNKTVAKQQLTVDPVQDGILATISRDGSDYTFVNHLQELPGIRGRGVTTSLNVPSLTYDSDEALSPANQLANNLVLTVTAVNFVKPVFKVTGDFYGSGGNSADGSFQDPDTGTEATYTKTLNNSTTIPYTSPSAGAPQVFTIKVQESEDATKEVTNIVNVPKLKQGLAGKSTAVVYLYKNSASSPTRPVNESGTFPDITVTLSGTGGGTIATSNTAVNSDGQVFDDNQSGDPGYGWFITPQTPTSGQFQWVIAATANGTGTTDVIGKAEWSIPAKFSGEEGLSGFNSRVVELYASVASKLTSSSDTDFSWCPTQDKTLTFANTTPLNSLPTSSNGGTTINWYYSIASALAANSITEVNDSYPYVYKTTAIGFSRETSVTIDGNDNNDCNWSTPALVVEKGGTGAAGTAGTRTSTGHLYYSTAAENSTGLNPDADNNASFNFVNGTFSGLDSGWSQNAPEAQGGTSQNKYWYVTYTALEGRTGSSSGAPTGNTSGVGGSLTFSSVFAGLNFTALVTVNSMTSTGTTTIDGSRIKTGRIQADPTKIGGSDVTDSTATGTDFTDAKGAYLVLSGDHAGAFATPGLAITTGGAVKVKGSIESSTFAVGNTFTGNGEIRLGASSGPYIKMRVDGNSGQPQMIIHDGSRERVKLGFLGSY